MTIYFYTANEQYGYLSNFSYHGFELDGAYWCTGEHYFQAQKFLAPEHQQKVREATTPREANKLGKSLSMPLRSDWEEIKDEVMKKLVLKKFKTHTKLCQLLLATGDEEIIEQSTVDSYWGCGPDGKGKNMLGKILMETRLILKK